MVKSIDFALRDGAGTVIYGSVSGDSAGEFIQVGADEDISLNLRKANILKYEKLDGDLVVTLADGRTITLHGFFMAPEGQENTLLISADGQIQQVTLEDMGNGVLFASYGEPEVTGDKWSPNDRLAFLEGDEILAPVAEDETTGMAAFAPALMTGLGGGGLAAAGLAGAALLGGSGGSNGGASIAPTVDDPQSEATLSTQTETQEAVVSGTGEPGSIVAVTIGDQSQSVEIGPGGTWEVIFSDETLPSDGDHEAVVEVTAPDGSEYTLDGPGFLIDMTPPDVAITEGAGSTGDVENLLEYADGITVSGGGEPGAAITVEVMGQTQSTTVGSDGSWSVTFAQDQLPGGTYEAAMTVTATDALGNVTTLSDTLAVDTEPHPISFDTVAGDDVINLVEQQAGVTITGQSTPGAQMVISLGGVELPATVDASGQWSVTFSPAQIGTGERELTFTATTTDAAGNVSTQSHAVQLDTVGQVAFSSDPITADDVVNAQEAGRITLSGTSEPGTQSVTVSFAGQTLPATVGADGSWSVDVTGAALSTGTYEARVSAVDAAGNTVSATRSVSVDLETNVAVDIGQAGGDDLLNAVEATSGLTITGSAESGATVQVNFEGTTRTVQADASGNWSASFSAAEVPAGTYDATVSVLATDLAGNTAQASHVLRVDTEVQNLTHATPTPNAILADGIVNATEAAGGLVVSGTVEAGSAVTVQLGSGVTIAATVTGTSWSATIPASALPNEEMQEVLSVRATDASGNAALQQSVITFDPLVRDFTISASVAGDGIVNAEEAERGFAISGTVEPGATVQVVLANGVTQTLVAGADGQWSAQFSGADLPGSEGTMTYQVFATDVVGNVSQTDGSFTYDLVAPESPDIIGFSRVETGLVGLLIENADDPLDFAAVDAGGAVSEVSLDGAPVVRSAYTSYDFQSTVPNGSYLVVSDTDAAGNEAATLLVVDNNAAVTVDLNRAGLSDFDFAEIDLSFAPEAELTITEAQIKALTGPDNTIAIEGNDNDHVTALGALDTGLTTTVDGHDMSIYTLGDTTLLIDDEITNVTI
ncbi:Ig-like domain-containing protein [Thioclava pacifica]|uniref:Bacterial Ig-like domain-containing protein n=1 Tax=Thioclava pacifica DSM 10166 TaxID=1353537 RepID=A0A074JF31_9RHOB|nr:Ig-like domain-containing protein [Thioclava pacifica]KEO54500.1 hypothetical protein TP2_06110 [Thioclava pacifica DSM 10166]